MMASTRDALDQELLDRLPAQSRRALLQELREAEKRGARSVVPVEIRLDTNGRVECVVIGRKYGW